MGTGHDSGNDSSDGDLTIRPEAPADHEAISAVVAAAFGSEAEVVLVDRIRSSPELVPEMALVAELDGAVVGHVMGSYAVVRNDDGERPISMLSPLAVHPDHHKRGIGGALVRALLEIADRRGEPAMIVEGDPRYYGRFGFEHSVTHGIEIHLPDWAPPEAAQVALLSAYDPDDPTLRGTVVYPAAFDGPEASRPRAW
jgi:putative acetyltransferase